MNWLDKYSDDFPKAQNGKKATRQDSLDVYNNSVKVQNYYNDKKYKKKSDTKTNISSKSLEDLAKLDIAAVEIGNEFKMIKTGKKGKIYGYNINNTIDVDDYYKKIDNNKYLKRESAVNILDLDAPMQLYDKRIQSNRLLSYENIDKNSPLKGDAVSMDTYHPLSVKPFDLLTEKQKVERVKKYGTSGVPKSYLDKIKQTSTTTTINTTKKITNNKTLTVDKRDKSKKSIIVSDKNDPRYKAYQDSLSLYEKNEKLITDIKNNPEYKTFGNHFPIDGSAHNKTRDFTRNTDDEGEPINDNIKPTSNILIKRTVKSPNTSPYKDKYPELTSITKVGRYKKPEQKVEVVKNTSKLNKGKEAITLKQRDKLKSIENNLQSTDVVQSNNELKGEQPVPIARVPKKYKVETSGGGKFGEWKINETVVDPDNISVDKGNKRTITPIYQEGGDIKTLVDPQSGDPYIPLEGVTLTQYDEQYPYYQNLSSEQQQYINDDSPIGRNVRGMALSGRRFNPDDAGGLFGNLIGGAFEIGQIPQAAMVEGVEAYRGKDYSFSNIHPELGGKQRTPSSVWGYKTPSTIPQHIMNFGMDAVLDPTNLVGAGMVTGLPKIGKNIGKEVVENIPKTLGDLKINHKLLNFEDLPEIMEKYRDPFIKKVGSEFGEKDLGLFAKLNEINDSRIMNQYDDPDIMKLIMEGKPDKLFSMVPRKVAKELTDNFTKVHDLSTNYTSREKLLADAYSNGYDDVFNSRLGTTNYLQDLYKPIREEFEQLILKNKTKRPEVFFRESDDFMVNNVWDDAGNKIEPMKFGDLQKGYQYEPGGFMSTTMAPSQIGFGNILSRINVPENQSVLNINSTGNRNYYNELENVLPSKLRYRIDDVIEDPLEYGKGYSKVFNKSIINSYKDGGEVIKDDKGQWAHPGKVTEINSPDITMQGVDYPVLGVSKQTGEQKMMLPEKNYKFANTKQVVEYPMVGNWLDKFQ